MARRNPYQGDARTRQAKAQGYPARSVFKLEEIDRRLKLLRARLRVVDLGAAPGSWSLYAAERIGPEGRLVAVDLQEITQKFPANVRVVQGDAFDIESAELAADGPYDVVLSDMAPRTTGSKIADQARSHELVLRAIDVAAAHGAPGGSFVAKIFMGPDFPEARAAVQAQFRKVSTIRPAGTRPSSTELFLVGMGRKG